jgi:hypothetical protein
MTAPVPDPTTVPGRYWACRSSSWSHSPRFSAPDSALHDAGRLCGLVGAALLLMRTRALDDSVPLSTRRARMAVALVLLDLAVLSSTWTITTGPGLAVMSTMAISAALHTSVLLVPALALRGHRS